MWRSICYFQMKVGGILCSECLECCGMLWKIGNGKFQLECSYFQLVWITALPAKLDHPHFLSIKVQPIKTCAPTNLNAWLGNTCFLLWFKESRHSSKHTFQWHANLMWYYKHFMLRQKATRIFKYLKSLWVSLGCLLCCFIFLQYVHNCPSILK